VTFCVYTPSGNQLNLGPSLELFAVFKELALLEPGPGYGELFGVPQVADEQLGLGYAASVRRQADHFLQLHGSAVSEHAAWVLGQLSGLEAAARAD
jgi:hypothetical protein